MNGMAEEETQTPDTAGKPPVEPAQEQKDSPFLGKLVIPQAPVSPEKPVAGDVSETTGGTGPEPVRVKPAVSQTTPPKNPPESGLQKLKPEDLLHRGNVISLLEQEAERRGDVPGLNTAGRTPETPTQRSIREIGLEPRPEKLSEQEQREKKRRHEEREREELPRIRTYAADMSEEIRKRGETLATIISAERSKSARGPIGNETTEKSEAPRQMQNALIIGSTVTLITIGIVVIVLAFVFSRPSPTETPHISLIPANEIESIETGPDTPLHSILAAERLAAELSLGEVKEIVMREAGVPLSAEEILTALGAPNVLARNADALMIGVHSFDRNQPFILISVSAYDRAFEGMLLWEPKIASDLGAFFAPSRLQGDQIYATPPSMEFTDRVFQNIDVRESDTSWRVMYAFPRRDLLLITTNESTLREVLTRMTFQ